MKPPHNHRPGGHGPSRGAPPDRGQRSGPPGPGGHHQGQGPRPPKQGDQQRPQGQQTQGGFGPRQHDRDHDQQRPFRPRHDAPHHHAPRPPEAPRGTLWIYGQHAIAAALANPSRRLRRLLITEEAEAALAQRLAPPWSVAPERVERVRLDQLLGRDAVHQGAAVLADPLPPPSLAQALDRGGPIIVLDQVTDPRNVGAILRSAAAFGAAALITQDRNAPEETGALAKAASGALETIPLLRAVNIARTLIALKAANLWTVGLDAAAPALSGPALAGRRVALVLGAEGTGLRRLTRDTCDEIAGLATRSAMESLNVSAAATVALYELTRRA